MLYHATIKAFFLFLLIFFSFQNTFSQMEYRLGIGGNTLIKPVHFDKDNFVNNKIQIEKSSSAAIGLGFNLHLIARYRINSRIKTGICVRTFLGLSLAALYEGKIFYYDIPIMARGEVRLSSDIEKRSSFFVGTGVGFNYLQVNRWFPDSNGSIGTYNDLIKYNGNLVGLALEGGFVFNTNPKSEWEMGVRCLFSFDNHYKDHTFGVFFSRSFDLTTKKKSIEKSSAK